MPEFFQDDTSVRRGGRKAIPSQEEPAVTPCIDFHVRAKRFWNFV
jgi:hypothetical protein